MSLERHLDARLSLQTTLMAPRFPPGIVDLNRANSEIMTNGEFLGEICKPISGFQELLGEIRTTDDYMWFWVALFRLDNNEVAIAFPWAQDWAKSDSSQSDRSIAVYAHLSVTDESLSVLLDKVTNSLRVLHEQREEEWEKKRAQQKQDIQR